MTWDRRTLDEALAYFTAELGHIGPVVIAGGAVRDALLEVEPRDIDVFVLNDAEPGIQKLRLDPKSQAALWVGKQGGQVDEEAMAYGPLVGNVEWCGFKVQVVVRGQRTLGELLETFDWQVACFGIGPGGVVVAGMDVADIRPGAFLLLNRDPLHPIATLRRGFRFAERFGMRIPLATIADLTARANEQAMGFLVSPVRSEKVWW